MDWYKQLGIKDKLSLLTALFAVGLLSYGAVAHTTLSAAKVGGPISAKVIEGKDLIADILPPPECIIESYLLVHELAEETDPLVIQKKIAKGESLRKVYEARHDYWVNQLPASKLKDFLVSKSYEPAMKFFEIRDREFIPALASGDRKKAEELSAGQLKNLYEAHRAAIDETVVLANEWSTELSANAQATIAKRTWIQMGIGLLTLVAAVVVGMVIARGIVSRISLARDVMNALATADFSKRVDITGRDELDQMGTSLNTAIDQTVDYVEQVKAISAAQAVIEFKMDGTIVTANDNFLKTLGYTLDEIKGKHHSMFVDPAFTRSPEYSQFWAKLNRGESDAGQYMRLAKGGREVWIQARYSALVDGLGRPYKVVEYASDISEQVRLQRSQKEQEEHERIAQAELQRKVNELLEVVNSAAEGDLTGEVTVTGEDPVGQLGSGLERMISDLRNLISQVVESAAQFTEGSRVVAESAQTLSQGAQTQSASVEEMSASIEELTRSIEAVKENAGGANRVARDTSALAEDGGTAVKKSVEAMERIKASSSQISEIIQVISEIASQTNLLALNAAIEAARAGEHGMGFAVVADEVRKLAERSSEAAKEISALIKESTQRVEEGAILSGQTGEALTKIIQGVEATAHRISEIAGATVEQATNAGEVASAIQQVSQITEQSAAGSEEMASSSEELGAQAAALRDLVSRFQLARVAHSHRSERTAVAPGAANVKETRQRPRRQHEVETAVEDITLQA